MPTWHTACGSHLISYIEDTEKEKDLEEHSYRRPDREASRGRKDYEERESRRNASSEQAKHKKKKRPWPVRFIFGLIRLTLIICLLVLAVPVGINIYIIVSSSSHIVTEDEAGRLEEIDHILVPGASVRGTVPSAMLQDRLDGAIEIYNDMADRDEESAPALLLSGTSQLYYDEVEAMKLYALDEGISEDALVLDGEGYSTYESMINARKNYKAKKIIITTQKYHLYRAVYIARRLGIDAVGVATDYREYSGQDTREIREVGARIKDFFMVTFPGHEAFFEEFFKDLASRFQKMME